MQFDYSGSQAAQPLREKALMALIIRTPPPS
jgi:hypothetical protein